jgi:hypothetical protein
MAKRPLDAPWGSHDACRMKPNLEGVSDGFNGSGESV